MAKQFNNLVLVDNEYMNDTDYQGADNYDQINEMASVAGVDSLMPEEREIYDSMLPDVPGETGHYDNLAEQLDELELQRIATELINLIDQDENSREDWEKREAKGIRLLGVSDKVDGGASFKGASKVVHPLLTEAISQFHSRAIAEMWPAEGPVKTQVLGEINNESAAQADRVQDYLNYLYTVKMPGAFEEEDSLLFRLPLSGSCFKKLYYDPLEDCLVSRLVEPSDFIVPYNAIDLRTAPRYTHRVFEHHNDVMKKIKSGHYRDITLASPIVEAYDKTAVRDEIDYTEGRADLQIDGDQTHTVLEVYIDYDLPGYEDIGEDGEATGVALPYIITVDRDEQTVLRIQRNYKPDDELRKKKLNFVHYKFSPGLGFYGYGLLHLIGGLSTAATGALRSLMDAAAFANLQGGYKTRDARIEGGDRAVGPGEWRETNATTEELSKAFFVLPYKEPSKTLYELLGYLDERGQRFASTTENMVGEANNSAPVGTTLALIEQGSKVFSAIHKRLHEAHTKEFKILHDLNYEYLPYGGYPYATVGAQNFIMQSDFDGRVDVIPVSDPAIISSTQRITQAQAVLDLAKEFPDIVNRRKAVESMFLAMRIPNVDELMVPESQEPSPEEQAQQLENQKVQAEIEKLTSETANKNIESQYSSLQAAQGIVTMPTITPIADELLASAGYTDANGAPVAGSQVLQEPMMQDPMAQEIPGNPNTNPLTPPNPMSPNQGVAEGIETMEADL